MVQFGNDLPETGDVEVDLVSNSWQGHGHDRNPAFKNVLLHVIWEGAQKTSLPTLALRPVLDCSLSDLALWLASDTAREFPGSLRGRCYAVTKELPASRREELLRQAALVRLQSKAAQLQARAREAGWEQALWEGLFRALGYKHNVWPMQRLAELQGMLQPRKDGLTLLPLQARLFGMGGLLPQELTRAQASTDSYIRGLWDHWWRERDTLAENVLPRNLWRFHGLRPANHPQRRLALAAHWMAQDSIPNRLESWCAQAIKKSHLVGSLLAVLQVPEDQFWSWHYTLRSPRLKKAQPLLGATRVTDLAVNVILPWLWSRASEGRNTLLQQELERRFLEWPPAEDNSVLRLARQRLFGGLGRRELLGTAAAQQGLLQITRDYCEQTNPICENCRFPALAGHFVPVGDKERIFPGTFPGGGVQ